MATTTIGNNSSTGTKNFYTENRTVYWVIGALVLAALIIFFSMGRETSQNAVMSTTPATVEPGRAPENVQLPNYGTPSSGTGAIDMQNSNIESTPGTAAPKTE